MTKRTAKLVLGSLTVMMISMIATAASAASGGAPDNKFTVMGWVALGAGLGMGIAAFGGALGQGRAAAAALEGIARNPGAQDKIFTPLILGLALIESLVIYSLIISIMLIGNLNLG